ncbi:MAG: MarR family winged helix-turn-helix transcriptional regulator [Candidatus Dormibacteria bacterium]
MPGSSFHPRLDAEPSRDARGRHYDAGLRHMLTQLGDLHPEPQATEALLSLLGASQALVERLEARMAGAGLSMSRFAVLMRLWRTQDSQAALHEVAGWCNVSPRNITGLVEGLTDAGLVERVPDPHDRRVILARMTPSGLALVERVARAHWDEQRALMAGLDDQERRQLVDLCVRLAARARKPLFGPVGAAVSEPPAEENGALPPASR